jgi:hypothetical protein
VTDAILTNHLLSAHPGARVPWFALSGYLKVMSDDALERLHAELVRQGEDCQRMKPWWDETRVA